MHGAHKHKALPQALDTVVITRMGSNWINSRRATVVIGLSPSELASGWSLLGTACHPSYITRVYYFIVLCTILIPWKIVLAYTPA